MSKPTIWFLAFACVWLLSTLVILGIAAIEERLDIDLSFWLIAAVFVYWGSFIAMCLAGLIALFQ